MIRRYHDAARVVRDRLRTRGAIVDMTRVTDVAIPAGAMRGLATQPAVFPDPSAPRLVIAPMPSAFGIARMYQQLGTTDQPGIRVVKTEAEAFAALGLDQPKFERLDEAETGATE